ncbi:unnamed protein product [marine sediment metagenome]|uniref:Uncharacterized protein n=1 Tax=marine sediment metagenome TaxID=412755 RepID=X1MN44_9ZZZZ
MRRIAKWEPRLADFEGGEGDGGEGGGQEPKTYYHLRLAPANQVKMMMDGGTSKKTFAAGVFEIADLQYDTAQFQYEYTTNN